MPIVSQYALEHSAVTSQNNDDKKQGYQHFPDQR